MVTLKDVAEEASVSIATVSYVVNDTRYVSPELTERVEEAMEKLGYQQNQIARGLKTEKTKTLGLVVSDITTPFFSTLVRGVEDTTIQNDHNLIIGNSDETQRKEDLYIDLLLGKKVDGLIIAPTKKQESKIEDISKTGTPLVFVDREIENISAPKILSENIQGAYKATTHLIKLGHERIGIVLGLKGVGTTKERLEGYKKALTENNIPINEELIVRGYSSIESGEEAVEKLLSLENPPTAIFSTNNKVNLGSLKAIKKLELSCPGDISLMGFDDSDWASIFEPTLTTIAQDPYKIGMEATELLFRTIEAKAKGEEPVGAEITRVPTELILRSSTAQI